MHLYNAWLPPVVAEETRREEESFAAVVRSVKDSWRRDDPDSVYSTLKWISVINMWVLLCLSSPITSLLGLELLGVWSFACLDRLATSTWSLMNRFCWVVLVLVVLKDLIVSPLLLFAFLFLVVSSRSFGGVKKWWVLLIVSTWLFRLGLLCCVALFLLVIYVLRTRNCR